MSTPTAQEHLTDLGGLPVFAAEGDKVGQIGEIFVDRETGQPEWAVVEGSGLALSKPTLVPLYGAKISPEGVFTPYWKELIKGTPKVSVDELDADAEAALYSHYNLGDPSRHQGTPAEFVGYAHDASSSDASAEDDAHTTVIRSEERLRVDKRPVEVGAVRLVKWVETEPVEEVVELGRETAIVERQPIDRPAAEGEIGEAQIEVPLMAEEVVVAKETVAKERIVVKKAVEMHSETVSEELRKEQVGVEHEGSLAGESAARDEAFLPPTGA